VNGNGFAQAADASGQDEKFYRCDGSEDKNCDCGVNGDAAAERDDTAVVSVGCGVCNEAAANG